MPRRPATEYSAFLRDLASQKLCLEDARRTHNSHAMTHAIQAIIDIRGIAQLANDADTTPDDITSDLQRAVGGDLTGIDELIRKLVEVWSVRQASGRNKIDKK